MCKGCTRNRLLYAAKQYHKRTTLHTMKFLLQSICSKEGLHYCLGAKRKKAVIWQATNAIYGMDALKIPLRSIRSEEGPHYRLRAKCEEAVIRQATINLFTSLDIPWWFHTQAVLRSLARPKSRKKVSVRGFLWERKVWILFSPTDVHSRNLWKRQKRENSKVVMLLPGSHKRLASRNPPFLFQKHGGACTMY